MHLRHCILFCSHQNKAPTETKKFICEAYGENVTSIGTCAKWHERFRKNNFDINDKEYFGPS